MTTTSWIRHNMIWEPKDMMEQRQPTEAELRVRQSLSKLSVPDWYRNKCRDSPKIINDRRPIDCRPAPWKSDRSCRSWRPINPKIFVEKSGESLKPLQPEEQTEMCSKDRAEQNRNEKPPKMTASPKNHASPKRKSKLNPNISRTFPKVSPSRKITNINIVFPPKQESPSNQGSIPIDSEPKTTKMAAPPTSSAENSKVIISTPSSPGQLPSKNPPTTSTKSVWLPAVSTPNKTAALPNLSTSNIAVKTTKTPIASTSSKPSQRRNNLFDSLRKSTELQTIVQTHHQRPAGKSLVEEIIQELNAKCKTSSKPSYISPESKNFVKKLVNALERGCNIPKSDDEETGSGVSSDSDTKSTSISYKDSDSDSDQSSTSMTTATDHSRRNSAFRNFADNLRKREEVYVDEEDDSVYWIPLSNCKLPRTSSLRSMMSRLSFNSVGASPIPSPIQEIGSRQTSHMSNVPGWSNSFEGKQRFARQLFRIDETAVTDSGYSGRSNNNSQCSSMIWYDDADTTRTVSDMSDDSDLLQVSGSRYANRLPSYSQRTYVIAN